MKRKHISTLLFLLGSLILLAAPAMILLAHWNIRWLTLEQYLLIVVAFAVTVWFYTGRGKNPDQEPNT